MPEIPPQQLNKMFGTIQNPLPALGEPNTLSICMIVKNEEDNISRAIRSFLPVADEIVVNDTGSNDNTLNILRQFPKVRVIQSEWKDDFSYSRNLSIDAARCSWILWMDADDVIPESMIGDILKLKTAPLDRGFGFQVVNTQAGMPVGVRFMQARMFPNHPEIRFERKVHEQIIFSLARLGLHMFYLETELWHMGYEEESVKKDKSRRNLKILLEDEDLERDPGLMAQLGDSYNILEDWENAVKWYTKAVDLPALSEMNHDLYLALPSNIGRCYQRWGKFEEALVWLEKALANDPQHLEAQFYKAELLYKHGRKQESVPLFEKLLASQMKHSSTGTQFDVLKIYSWKYLCDWYQSEKRTDLLLETAKIFHEAYPQVLETSLYLGKACISAGLDKEGVQLLTAVMDQRPDLDSDAWHALVLGWDRLGNTQMVQETRTKMQQAFPSGVDGPMLSICMIVKNEEQSLAECLQSIQGLADELIIADTGSEDRTVEIAKQFGARVEHFTWCDDFAAARNFSISKATGQWILWLDADDRVLEEDKSRIRALVKSQIPRPPKRQLKAWGFLVKNSTDGGNTGSVFNQIRLFPNFQGIEFRGRIHEQLLPALTEKSIGAEFTDIRIIHAGYTDPETVQKKQQRNLEILTGDLENNPSAHTAVRYYSIAGACKDLRDFSQAVEWYQKAVEQAEKKGEDPHVLQGAPVQIAACYAEMELYEEALHGVESILQQNALMPDALLLRAQVLWAMGKHNDSLEAFGFLFWFEEQNTLLPVDFQGMKVQALHRMAEFWDTQNNREVALVFLRLGVGLSKGEDVSVWKLVSHWFELEQYEFCLHVLEFGLHFGESAELYLNLGKAAIMVNDVPKALRFLQDGVKNYPGSEELISLLDMLQKDISG